MINYYLNRKCFNLGPKLLLISSINNTSQNHSILFKNNFTGLHEVKTEKPYKSTWRRLLVLTCAGFCLTNYFDNKENKYFKKKDPTNSSCKSYFSLYSTDPRGYLSKNIKILFQFGFLTSNFRALNNCNFVQCENIDKYPGRNQPYNIPKRPRSETFKFGNLKLNVNQIDSNKPIEDRYSISTVQRNNTNLLVASVIDGHGGWVAAEFIANNIVQHLYPAIVKDSEPHDADLIKAFEFLDKSLENFLFGNSQNSYVKGGACCITVIISDKVIKVANVGDCMAVLSRKNETIEMNFRHNANDPIERKRITDAHPNEKDAVSCKRSWVGPKVANTTLEKYLSLIGALGEETFYSGCYVKSALNPTRSFGDFALKDQKYSFDNKRNRFIISKPFSFPYISATPEVTSFNRSDLDNFIIIASDGLWDFLTPSEAVEIVKLNIVDSIELASQKLIDAALEKSCQESGYTLETLLNLKERRNYYDDITVCIINLQD